MTKSIYHALEFAVAMFLGLGLPMMLLIIFAAIGR